MLVHLTKDWGKETENTFTVKVPYIKVHGRMIKKFQGTLSYLMEIYLKGNSETIWDTTECTGIKMETSIKEHGKMT